MAVEKNKVTSRLFVAQFIILCGTVSFSNAFAQSGASNSNNGPLVHEQPQNQEENVSKFNDKGFSLFLGASGGYVLSSSKIKELESDKRGYSLLGRTLGSLYSQNWLLDFGIGWLYNHMSGEDAASLLPDANAAEGTYVPVQVVTQAAVGELALRYRLTENWQLGVMGDVLFGTDVSFSATAPRRNVSGFAGLQLKYGWSTKTYDIRIGTDLMASINLPEKQIYIAFLTFEIGLPILKPDIIVRKNEIVTMRERVKKEEVEKVTNKVVVREVLKFTLESEKIRFKQGSDQIPVESYSFVGEFTRILLSSGVDFKKLTIESHVNPIRDAKTTKDLSTQRAASMKAALIGAGLPAEKMEHIGLGSSQPLIPGAAPRNERIVLSFSGVTNDRQLSDAINSFLRKKFIPPTCTEQGCK